MVRTSAEQIITANEPFVACDHVIEEHGDGRAAQFVERHDLELRFEADRGGQFVAQAFKRVAVPEFKGVAVAAHENVKLKIVIGLFAIASFEHAAFTPTMAAAE